MCDVTDETKEENHAMEGDRDHSPEPSSLVPSPGICLVDTLNCHWWGVRGPANRENEKLNIYVKV